MLSSNQVTLNSTSPTLLVTASGKTKIFLSGGPNGLPGVFIGGPSVTTSSGFPLPSGANTPGLGAEFDLENGDSIYGIANLGNPVVYILIQR